MQHPKTNVLIVLDGWGHRVESSGNAIVLAKTPNWHALMARYPHTYLSGSGEDVGLPAGQMGNSEVGHLTLGAGRVVDQDLPRISKALAAGGVDNQAAFDLLCKDTQDTALHLIGLLSPGGVHSHEDHLLAFIDLAAAKGVKNIYVHAILDGRDMPPKSAEASLHKLIAHFKKTGVGQIASIVGRYYAMDRDKRWERVEQAYDLLTLQGAYIAANPIAALEAAYTRGETDEFVLPTEIEGMPRVSSGDSICYFNFRADRARALSYAFALPDFKGFSPKVRVNLCHYMTMTPYDDLLTCPVFFPSQTIRNTLAEYLANLGRSQFRLAESEKYAHVTFFFNGGQECPVAQETRLLIPSPKVPTYDECPEMSAYEVCDALVAAILSQSYDFILCNFANADMVGHTGNLEATEHAIEALDVCLGRIAEALVKTGSEALITADHGNAEFMFDPATGQPHTAHTCSPVPLLYIGRPATLAKQGGTLADVAPTLLTLMGLKAPAEMTGHSLVEFT